MTVLSGKKLKRKINFKIIYKFLGSVLAINMNTDYVSPKTDFTYLKL